MNNEDLALIVMENCEEFGSKVDEYLKKKYDSEKSFIIDSKIDRFNNGEAKATINSTVRGKRIFIISDCTNYSITYKMYDFINHMGPDEHFQDIKRIISAMTGHAKEIYVIMPFLYESRQHRRECRESLDCANALQDLERMHVKGIITFDVHDQSVINAIPFTPFETPFPTIEILKDFIVKENIVSDDTMIIAPDFGASKRARHFAEILESNYGMFEKRRDLTKIVDGKNPIIGHDYFGSSFKGKETIVVDDMIASGGSILEVASFLKAGKAKKVFLLTTFALFTSGISKFDKAYEDGLFDKIYTTNLAYIPEDYKEREYLEIVDCSELLANYISTIYSDKSITQLDRNYRKDIKKLRETIL